MSRDQLILLHKIEQQGAAINEGKKGRFASFDEQCEDYLRKLVQKEIEMPVTRGN